MADFANVAEQIAFRIDLWDELEKETAASPGHATRADAALNDIEGSYAQRARQSIEDDRARIAAILARTNVRAGLEPYLRQMGGPAAIDSPAVNVSGGQDQLWQDLFDYMHANGESVNSAEFAYDAFAAGGSNVGTGELIRLTVDEYGYDLEGWWPDTYTAECEQDARQTGLAHVERWRINGTAPSEDPLDRAGSGLDSGLIDGVTGAVSRRYVRNPSFDVFTGAAVVGTPAAPTALDGWAGYSSLSNFENDLDITYRAVPGASTSASIRFLTNETLSQDLVAVGGARLDADVPYYVDVAVYRRDSCDGTLTMTLGGVSRAVTMSTLTNSAWNVVRLVSTPSEDCWPRNFNANGLTLSFTLASRTTGSLHLDDITFAPFTRIGAGGDTRRGRGAMGTYVVFRGGATPWVKGDLYTATDTVGGTRAVNQHWFGWAERGYLPAVTGGTETWADK